MRKLVLFALFLLCSAPGFANPTGAPLRFYPVEPCRVVDTRAALGPVLSYPSDSLSFFVRGSNLLPEYGAAQTDCGVPLAAEAVTINVTAVNPSGAGSLRINGVNRVHGPMGIYSRVNFAAGQTVANEMTVSLCNVYLYPAAHAPCPWDTDGHYQDVAVLADMSAGKAVHIVADVVGYWAR